MTLDLATYAETDPIDNGFRGPALQGPGSAALFRDAVLRLDESGGGTLLIGQPGDLAAFAHVDPADSPGAWEVEGGVTIGMPLQNSIVIQGVGNPVIRLTAPAGDFMFRFSTGQKFLQIRDLTLDVNGMASRGLQIESDALNDAVAGAGAGGEDEDDGAPEDGGAPGDGQGPEADGVPGAGAPARDGASPFVLRGNRVVRPDLDGGGRPSPDSHAVVRLGGEPVNADDLHDPFPAADEGGAPNAFPPADPDGDPNPFRVRIKDVTVLNCLQTLVPEGDADALDEQGQRRAHASAAGVHVRGAYSIVELLDCTVDGVTSDVTPYLSRVNGEWEPSRIAVVAGVDIAAGDQGSCRRIDIRGGRVANIHHASLRRRAYRLVADGIHVSSDDADQDSSVDISGVEFRDCQAGSVRARAAALTVRGCAFYRQKWGGFVEVDAEWGAATVTGNVFFYTDKDVGVLVRATQRSAHPKSQLVATGNVVEFNPPGANLEAGLETSVFQVLVPFDPDDWDDNHQPRHWITHAVIQGNTVRGLCKDLASFEAGGGGVFCLVNNVVQGCEEALISVDGRPAPAQAGAAIFLGIVRNNASTGPESSFVHLVDAHLAGSFGVGENLGFRNVP